MKGARAMYYVVVDTRQRPRAMRALFAFYLFCVVYRAPAPCFGLFRVETTTSCASLDPSRVPTGPGGGFPEGGLAPRAVRVLFLALLSRSAVLL